MLRVLLPIWTAKAETRRDRQRIRAVLCWAEAHGFTSGNVAAEGIDGTLPKVNGRMTHFRALPYQEVEEARATVVTSPASLAARLCFRLLVLTAALRHVRQGRNRWRSSQLQLEAARPIPRNRQPHRARPRQYTLPVVTVPVGPRPRLLAALQVRLHLRLQSTLRQRLLELREQAPALNRLSRILSAQQLV